MPKFLDVTDKAAARAALHLPTVSLLDHISDPDDTASHQAGFEAAIAAAVAAGGAEIIVPPGEWFADDLEIPAQTPIKISGSVADTFPNNQEVNGGSWGSRITRTRDLPIFSCVGSSAVLPGYDWQGFVRNFTLCDLTLCTAAAPAVFTQPMIYARGMSVLRMTRVEMFGGSNYGYSLLDFQGVWDTRIQDCQFSGGGQNSGEIPALWFRSGDETGVDGYNGCNSIVLVNCSNSEYNGPAIHFGQDVVTPSQTNLCCLVNHKMDSTTCTTSHLVLERVSGIHIANSWISHSKTAGAVMDIRRGNGVYGDITFNYANIPGKVLPSAMVETSATAYNIDLDVHVMANDGITSDINIVTQAVESNNTVFRINGASQRVNDKAPSVWTYANTVWQQAESTNGLCQYVFDRDGVNRWAIGNPSNPSGTVQQMDIKGFDNSGNIATFLSLKSADTNPVTSQRTVTAHGDLAVTEDLTVTGSTRTDMIRTTDGSAVMQIGALTNGNYFYVQASSGNPTLQVSGTSTDINVNLMPKGAGTVTIYVNSGETPTVEARGADTNHDLNLRSKGTGIVRANGWPLGVKVGVPASAGAAGALGQWAADSSYVYICTAANTWRRAAIATW